MGDGGDEALSACLLEPASLTDRLISSGRQFSVDVLYQGQDEAWVDEAGQVAVAVGAPVLARHVALKLDGTVVVVARSYCRWNCPVWAPMLDRGSRSLGFTLFSGEVALRLDPLEFRLIGATHPLFALARGIAPGPTQYPARRRRFMLDHAGLVVCELFLPSLAGQMRRPVANHATE
jgi:chorismate lyase